MITTSRDPQLLAIRSSGIFADMERPERTITNSVQENLFSPQSSRYARYRPSYPSELYSYLLTKAPGRKLAWDAGCGTGQASIALGEFFERVYATDPSAEQIAQGTPHDRVAYAVEPAEQVGLGNGEVDLVTAAAALHWFDTNRFFAEARRVLRTGGILAVWGYSVPLAPELKPLVSKLYWPLLDPYWPERLRTLFGRYGSLEKYFAEFEWTFTELKVPTVEMEVVLNREGFLNYLGTWSAAEAYRQSLGRDPLQELREALSDAWPDPDRKRTLRSNIFMRVGQK